MTPTGELLGVPIGPRSLPDLIAAVVAAMASRRAPLRSRGQPPLAGYGQLDPAFRDALRHATAVVADGVGCLVGAKLAGVRVGPRITGFDFFRATMVELNRAGGRAFFFGSSEQVLALLRARCAADFPAVSIETLSPPYGDWSPDQSSEFIERINATRPDVLWVAMTAPKQEKWMARISRRSRCP